MRLVAVNRFYRPDHSATSQILTDLAEALVRDGHDVTVVTSRLGYEDAKAGLPPRETLDGVKVIRVPSTRMGRAGALGRMVDYLTYYFAAIFTLLGEVKKGDFLLAKTDPPLMSVAAAFVSRLKGAHLINWCQDLFPEVAGALGMGWAKGPAGKALIWLRNRSLHRAKTNVVLNQNMKDKLVEEGIPAQQISILPNWCDARIRPVARTDNELRAKWELTEKTVIGYSGNLGRAHLPEEIAKLLRCADGLDEISWLFIGGGKGVAEVQAAAAEVSTEVQFRPYQPLERLSESLSIADIHLITLAPDCEGLIMPSKYYGVLAVDRPVLFLGSPQGSIAKEIDAHGHGAVLDIAKPDTWRATVEELVEDCEARRGKVDPTEGHAGLGLWREKLSSLQ